MSTLPSGYYPVKAKVYITRRVPQRGVDVLLEECNVSMWESEEMVPRGELLQGVVGAAGIMCMPSDHIDKEVLDRAGPTLRAVATMSTVSDHIDVRECNRRHIRVLVSPRQATEGVPDVTVALILLTLKRCSDVSLRAIKMQPDHPKKLCLQHLDNKTFGIYGLTLLGHSVARRLKDLRAGSVIAADYTYSKYMSDAEIEIVPWSELLRRADIICICAQDDDQPKQVFSKDVFEKMKPTAIIIDCRNSSAVNYEHLYEALKDKQIAGTGINDCNQRPVPFKYPLMGLRNCVFLPQTHESSYDIRHKLSISVARELKDAVRSPVILEQ